jgi:hypothetical protein
MIVDRWGSGEVEVSPHDPRPIISQNKKRGGANFLPPVFFPPGGAYTYTLRPKSAKRAVLALLWGPGV